MMPMSPIAIKPPIEVKSRLVVIPYMLQARKVAAQIKNVDILNSQLGRVRLEFFEFWQ